jgi:hypothetical protein
MNKTDLVILKGSNELKFKTDTLYPNTYYRCIKLEENGVVQYLVYGINMDDEFFKEHFEFAYDRIMRDWEQIGLVKNGKPITKKDFKELANVHTYGKQNQNLRIMFFGHPKEGMYGFYPTVSENKAKQLDRLYSWYLLILTNGNMNYFDQNNIQFGNKGIPLSYGSLRKF